ncbi:MAG: RNA 2',3'-cyclic phosphodiesterase [Pseudomonadales bacterium]
MALIRAFFAVPLSVAAEQQFVCHAQQLESYLHKQLGQEALNRKTRIRWVSPVNYHLTVVFLGDIRPQDIERLHTAALLVAEQFTVDTLHFSALQWFPSALKPRLIVAIPEQNTTLLALYKTLSKSLRREGFNVENRAFRPHVSLARTKALTTPADLSDFSLDINSALDELVLFKSEQAAGGSIYTPLFVEPIGARLIRR